MTDATTPRDDRVLVGTAVTLRLATPEDRPALRAILAAPEVARWWSDADIDIDQPDVTVYAIELDRQVIGAVQWHAEEDADFRHAGLDIFLDPEVHGSGLGTDAVRTLARYLIAERGFHRLVIDPAADNAVAIRCYRKVGFRPVGIMREYWRDSSGTWRDGLLMDLLARELTEAPS